MFHLANTISSSAIKVGNLTVLSVLAVWMFLLSTPTSARQLVNQAVVQFESSSGLVFSEVSNTSEVSTLQLLDFGDAPDSYRTLLKSNGARHRVVDGLGIGQLPDTEPDGFLGSGDEDNGSLDEDSLSFQIATFAPLSDFSIENISVLNDTGMRAVLFGWIDFDSDGQFSESERATTVVEPQVADASVPNKPLLPVTLTWNNLDLSEIETFTYVRLRLALEGDLLAGSNGGLDEASFGLANSGEVEDYAIDIRVQFGYDYGDAPESYSTLSSDDGAAHFVYREPLLYIGDPPDAEDEAEVGGDENNGSSDEGDVLLPSLTVAANDYSIPGVRVTNNTGALATLLAWIDFDGNGRFDEDERVGYAISEGTQTVSLEWPELPSDTIPGQTAVRFRLFPSGEGDPGSDGGVDEASYGVSSDGEVEDYTLSIVRGNILLLEKSADRNVIDIGDALYYELRLKNLSSSSIESVEIVDQLPFGFRYIPQSSSVDGTKTNDPTGAPGPRLVYVIDSIEPQQEIAIRYALQTTAGAVDSDGVNQAVAQSYLPDLSSNLARAKVDVRRTGVLSDRAYIFGKVFVDTNCNNRQDSGEWPIGGVTLYLEDGTYAITDENGQYSLYGIEPGQHIIKLDGLTLPESLSLKPIDNRHAADPESRFVDLAPAEYHRADFAASCPDPLIADRIEKSLIERNKSIAGDWMLEQASRFNPTVSRSHNDIGRAQETGGDISSGRLNLIGTNDSTRVKDRNNEDTNVLPSVEPGNSQPDLADTLVSVKENSQQPSNAKMPSTKEVAATVTNDQAKAGTWIWPTNDTSYHGRFMAVVRTGVLPTLYVNGIQVSESQLGEQIVNKRQRAQVLSWYGVDLNEGENLLEIKGFDIFGNERTLASKSFVKPGSANALQIIAEDKQVPADGGRSLLPLTIELNDATGHPAKGVFFATLETGSGQWLESDIQSQTPGHQVRLENGSAKVHLRSPNTEGNVQIRASVDNFKDSTTAYFHAPLRPLIAAGIASLNYHRSSNEDTVNFSNQRKNQNDGFEQRAALFLKGRVKGDYHLTLAYDSEKDSDADLLRDIDPNNFYPIQGDGSLRGYEAQSRSKTYVKLAKEKSSILWGDFVTDSDAMQDDLTRYQRTLTGAMGYLTEVLLA